MLPIAGFRLPEHCAAPALASLLLMASSPDLAPAQPAGPDSLLHSTRGLAFASSAGAQYDAVSLADGTGGVFAAWVDERGEHADIYVVRIGPDGRPASGWPAGGRAACRAERGQYGPRLATDGAGGLYVAWEDLRGPAPSVFLQHFLADGRRDPAWPSDGMPVCSAEFPQFMPDLIGDGAGGAIVAWEDQRGPSSALYVQRIAVDATVEVGWPTNGVPLTPGSGGQFLPKLVTDEANGVLVFWEDTRTGASAVYGQRVTWRGKRADGWPAGGTVLSPSIGRQDLVRPVRDGAGGAIVGWRDMRRGTPDLFVARIEGSGTHAASWPTTGVTLSTYPGDKSGLKLAADGTGGIFAIWEDSRSGSASMIYGQRLDATGRRPSGWPNDGRAFSTSAGYQIASSIVPDGAGGVFAVWQDFREGQSHVYGQYLTAGAAPADGWPSEGLRLASDAAGQIAPVATPDGAGGVFLIWEQGLANADLHASRVSPTGLGATYVTLTSTEVGRDRIVVRWRAQAGASFELIAQRRRDDADWIDLAARVPAADGEILIVDTDVAPGRRYGYRLARNTSNGREYMGEVWISTDEAPVLALAGMVPNPARADLRVSLSLPARGAGIIELIDVAGRRMRWHDLGTLGPGRHVVDLGAGGPVPPGFYLVRLQFEGRVLTTRGTVIR